MDEIGRGLRIRRLHDGGVVDVGVDAGRDGEGWAWGGLLWCLS